MSEKYFNKLNYSLANEDTTLEMNILQPQAGHVVSVAGSGARVLPLFAKQPAQMTIVDLSNEQLWLSELRIETARILEHEDYLKFWGYPPNIGSPEFRRRVLSEVMISDACRNFFRRVFDELQWQSVLYNGRWERTFDKISRLCRSLLGEDAVRIFESTTIQEHMKYMLSEFPRLKWNFLIFVVGNSSFFNAFLYGGHFPKKNTEGSHRSFYQNAYDRIFAAGLPRENFFLQLTLLGEIKYAEGNPVECREDVFELIKKGIRSARIQYVNNNVVECVEGLTATPADFVSLSDVPSYFDDSTSINFLSRMSSGLNPQALVVARYYLRVLDAMNREGYFTVSQKYRASIDVEKTQMYHIDVYQKS